MRAQVNLPQHSPFPPARQGVRTLTHAHVLLAQHPEVGAVGGGLLARAEEAWRSLLGVGLSVKATLLDAAFVPARSLSLQSAFAVFELSPLGVPAVLEIDFPAVTEVLELLSGDSGSCHAAFQLTRAEQAALAPIGLDDAQEHAQGRGFPGTIGAQYAVYASLGNGEVDTADRRISVKRLEEALRLNS